jgi:hypothetical protein
VNIMRLPQEVRAQLPDLACGGGFVIRSVDAGGPADLAGLRPNDVIWKINGQILVNEAQLWVLLGIWQPGEVVAVEYFRGGRPATAKLALGKAPPGGGFAVAPSKTPFVIGPPGSGSPLHIVNVPLRKAMIEHDDGRAVLTFDQTGFHVEITDPDGTLASYGSGADATGPADATGWYPDPTDPDDPTPYQVVSLGDGGMATATFAAPIADGPGPDFAVFENSMNDTFLELAFVEVSSDGVHFARFPAISLTPVDTQVAGSVDTTDIHNLAGKYRAGFGTPFDLADIRDPRVNTSAITHVRVVDVVGTVGLATDEETGEIHFDPALAALAGKDSEGRMVNDPYPTPYYSCGFDLDAIGVIHKAPGSWAEWSQFYFGAGNADPDADPDADGLPNRLEWALWTSPLAPSPGLGIQSGGDGTPRLVFRYDSVLRPGSSLVVFGSTGLATWEKLAESGAGGWQPAAPGVEVRVEEGAPDFISILAPPAPRRFFRCQVVP